MTQVSDLKKTVAVLDARGPRFGAAITTVVFAAALATHNAWYRARLGAHHIALAWGDEFVGGIGLPALEHLKRNRPLKVREVGAEPCVQRGLVYAVCAGHGLGVWCVVPAHAWAPVSGRLR